MKDPSVQMNKRSKSSKQFWYLCEIFQNFKTLLGKVVSFRVVFADNLGVKHQLLMVTNLLLLLLLLLISPVPTVFPSTAVVGRYHCVCLLITAHCFSLIPIDMLGYIRRMGSCGRQHHQHVQEVLLSPPAGQRRHGCGGLL